MKFRNVIKTVISELPQSWGLGYRLAARNIKARYRQSIFGLIWAFLPPIATALVWLFLKNSKVIDLGESGIPYPAFVFTGTLLWQLFARSVTIPISSVQSNKSILTKINIPKEALVFNAFFEILFNAILSSIILIAVFFAFMPDIGWTIVLAPVGILILILIGICIGVLLLPIGLLFKDIGYGIPMIMQFLMYLTPVIYPKPDSYEGLARILEFNPVTPVLTNTRSWLYGSMSIEELPLVLLIGAGAFFLTFFGIFVQRISISILVERMGS